MADKVTDEDTQYLNADRKQNFQRWYSPQITNDRFKHPATS
jgi:hypothetical protein